jgi:hypothetical protein
MRDPLIESPVYDADTVSDASRVEEFLKHFLSGTLLENVIGALSCDITFELLSSDFQPVHTTNDGKSYALSAITGFHDMHPVILEQKAKWIENRRLGLLLDEMIRIVTRCSASKTDGSPYVVDPTTNSLSFKQWVSLQFSEKFANLLFANDSNVDDSIPSGCSYCCLFSGRKYLQDKKLQEIGEALEEIYNLKKDACPSDRVRDQAMPLS